MGFLNMQRCFKEKAGSGVRFNPTSATNFS
jgi:hypothetical protein